MNKRGVSPLIATILLLILAIGLGIIVMNWGRAQVEAASKCAVNIQLDVVKLNNIPEICQAGAGEQGYLHFIVENGVNIDVEALQIRIIGTKGKTLKTLAELSSCHISLDNNTVNIIGPAEKIKDTATAIERLIKGSKQTNVYLYLKKTQKESIEDLGLKK